MIDIFEAPVRAATAVGETAATPPSTSSSSTARTSFKRASCVPGISRDDTLRSHLNSWRGRQERRTFFGTGPSWASCATAGARGRFNKMRARLNPLLEAPWTWNW